MRFTYALLALVWAAPAAAAPMTWSHPEPIGTAEQTLGLPGHIVAAVHFGPRPDIEVKLASGRVVNFLASATAKAVDLSHVGGRHAGLFAFKGSGNDAFDKVLSGGTTEGGSDSGGLLTLRGLTPGKRYTVQLFAIDMRGKGVCGGDRDDCRTRLVHFGDGLGHFSRRVLEGSGSYTLGTFTADAATQTIVVRGWSTNAAGEEAWTLNAVVVYQP